MVDTHSLKKKLNALSKETQVVFKEWDHYLKDLVSVHSSDLVIRPKKHAQIRGKERDMTIGQMGHVLKNHKRLRHIQITTRPGSFGLRIEGKDFDEQDIAVVAIPGSTGYKIITAFYIEGK